MFGNRLGWGISAVLAIGMGLLLWLFVYCYPIARWTVRLEARYAVKQ